MRHTHQADINIRFDIPIQDLERLADQITDAALTLIVVSVAAHILKSFFN